MTRNIVLRTHHWIITIKKSRGPKAPKKLALRLFAVAAVPFIGIRR